MSITAARGSGPVITAWSAVSPYGIGGPALTDGLRSRTRTEPAEGPDEWLSEGTAPARTVPGFDTREVLGKVGTRGFDRMTGLTATAVRELLGDDEGGTGTGFVLGTAAGSVQGFLEFTKASFEGKRPIDVPPSKAPNMAMNRAASACAIRHRLQGPNSTVAAGRVSGLIALSHARRLLDDGRADRVLCGAVEEYSAARAHLARTAHPDQTTLGEGCALLMLEPAAAAAGTALAEVLAVHHRVAADGDFAAGLGAALKSALDLAGVHTDEVWAVVPGGAPGAAGEQERELVQRLFTAQVRDRVPAPELGDTAAASAAFQIAALLAAPDGLGRIAVVTSTDPEGSVACAVLRLLGGDR